MLREQSATVPQQKWINKSSAKNGLLIDDHFFGYGIISIALNTRRDKSRDYTIEAAAPASSVRIK